MKLFTVNIIFNCDCECNFLVVSENKENTEIKAGEKFIKEFKTNEYSISVHEINEVDGYKINLEKI